VARRLRGGSAVVDGDRGASRTLAAVEVEVLGPLVVGGGVTPAASKERAVLELLALRAGAAVSEAALIEGVWGEAPPATAAKTLHTMVSRLRRRPPGLPIVRDGTGYRLQVEAQSVDVHRFEALARRGRAALADAAYDEAIRSLSAAVALWRGSPLADIAGGAGAADVARLEHVRCEVEEDLVAAQLGGCPELISIGHVERLVRSYPLRERRWGQLMLALYRDGRRAEALRAFQQARQVLAEATGLAPGPDLVALERAILDDDPALRRAPAPAPRRSRTSLPVWVTSLVGRDEERARVLERLGGARLVTLTGIGGVGKTRLAAAVATDALTRMPGPVHFVDLSPVRTPEAVEDAVAAALEVPWHPDRTLTDQIARTLAPGPALLVMDNCEEVIDGVARLVRDLIEQVSGLRILATSREPLALTGETVERVDPLPVPTVDHPDAPAIAASPAVRLFIDRAEHVDPELGVRDETASFLADICRALDGIPLAIEIAAAHADVLGPAQLRAHLVRGERALLNPRRDRQLRHESMASVLDWSYRHLGDTERRLLDRLAVFRGPATLEAIQTVVTDELLPVDAVLEALGRLVRRCLVVTISNGTERRYGLLETVRAYGWQRLVDVDELTTWRTRHLDWVVAMLSDAAAGWARDVARWHRTIEDHADDIEHALAWAAITPGHADQALLAVAGIFSYWGTRRSVGARWCRTLAHAATGLEPARRADALWHACFLMGGIDLGAASSIAREARGLAIEAAGDAAVEGLAALSEMTCAVFSGDLPALRAGYGRAAPHLEGIPRLFADYFDMWATSLRNDHQRAHHMVRHLLRRVRDLGDEHIYTGFLGEVVDLALMTDADREQLRDEARDALAIARRVPCPLCESKALTSLVLVDAAAQPGAVDQARLAVRRAHDSGLPFAVVLAVPGLEAALLAGGSSEEAVALAAATEALRRHTGHCHLLPARRQLHERTVGTARTILGEPRFSAAWAHGAELTYDRLITLAVGPPHAGR
jgi:predicted ATPase/DNA-binding SARP family transcriptional activator